MQEPVVQKARKTNCRG